MLVRSVFFNVLFISVLPFPKESLSSSFCKKFYTQNGKRASTANLLAGDLLEAFDRTIPEIEQRAIDVREHKMKEYDGNEETPWVAFYKILDEVSREHKDFPRLLLRQALNCFPYLRRMHFNIVLSGGTVENWTPLLQEAAKKEGVSFSIVQLPGGISPRLFA